MAKDVSKANRVTPSILVKAGGQLLDAVTSGMYSNALMVVREYVQNAVDSIDDAVASGLLDRDKGRIDISIDGSARTLSVEDNGTGVNDHDAAAVLCSLGVSAKCGSGKRGFRGIGRLGGIGYCEKLVFETRAAKHAYVTTVTWDCAKLRGLLSRPSHEEINLLVESVTAVNRRLALHTDPSRFFRVTMHGVHRFHKDELMNVGTVGTYLGQIAPLPFNAPEFSFADQIKTHLAVVDGYRSYTVWLNGVQLHRPHRDGFVLSSSNGDSITGIELFELKGRNGERIGRGWYGRTNCLASIPPAVGMRGIRIRQGNIEIGNEYYLEDSFAERRFATWHIGEIHLCYCVRANARRDGFEQSSEYEAFLEQARMLGRHLSQMCRTSSKKRSQRVTLERMLNRAERLTSHPFAIDSAHHERTRAELELLLARLREADGETALVPRFKHRLNAVCAAAEELTEQPPFLADVLDGRSLRHVDAKSVLGEVARSILQHHDGQVTAEELVELVLSPYIKKS